MAPRDGEVDRQFNTAVELIKTLPGESSLSSTDQLEFYGLFKQATKGDVTDSCPWAPVAAAKWKAHNARKGTDQIEAKVMYVDLLLKLLASYDEPQARVMMDKIRPPQKIIDSLDTKQANGSMLRPDSTSASAAIATPQKLTSDETPRVKPQSINENGPLSFSTPMKRGDKRSADGDEASLGAVSDHSDSFHDSVDATDLGRGDLQTASIPRNIHQDTAQGHPIASSSSSIDQTLDKLQRELNSTTNRVRELEFLLRENPERAINSQRRSLGFLSNRNAQAAAIFLWPVVVHYALSWSERPRRHR